MTRIFQEPGLHTDTPNPLDPVVLRSCNFKWIVQQTQNGANPVKPLNLSAYKNVGFKVGAWGVSYNDGRSINPEDDCKRLLGSATGTDLLVHNIEHDHDPRPYIKGLAQFPGPKALITLVGLLTKIDISLYLDAGWDIIGETYWNDQANLSPAVSEFQAKQAGIPVDRYSHALGTYFGLRQRFVTGAEYAAGLQAAKSGRRFSLWMVEQGPTSNFLELKAQALAQNPTVSPTVPVQKTLIQIRDQALEILDEAVAPPSSTRVNHMQRVGRSNENQRVQIDPFLKSIGL